MILDFRTQRANAFGAPNRVPVRPIYLGKVEGILEAELGQYLIVEHIRQLHGDGIENAKGAAAQMRQCIRFGLVSISLLRLHGGVESGRGVPSVVAFSKLSFGASDSDLSEKKQRRVREKFPTTAFRILPIRARPF